MPVFYCYLALDQCKYCNIFALIGTKPTNETLMRRIYIAVMETDTFYAFYRTLSNLQKVKKLIEKRTGTHYDYTKLTRHFKNLDRLVIPGRGKNDGEKWTIVATELE